MNLNFLKFNLRFSLAMVTVFMVALPQAVAFRHGPGFLSELLLLALFGKNSPWRSEP